MPQVCQHPTLSRGGIRPQSDKNHFFKFSLCSRLQLWSELRQTKFKMLGMRTSSIVQYCHLRSFVFQCCFHHHSDPPSRENNQTFIHSNQTASFKLSLPAFNPTRSYYFIESKINLGCKALVHILRVHDLKLIYGRVNTHLTISTNSKNSSDH